MSDAGPRATAAAPGVHKAPPAAAAATPAAASPPRQVPAQPSTIFPIASGRTSDSPDDAPCSPNPAASRRRSGQTSAKSRPAVATRPSASSSSSSHRAAAAAAGTASASLGATRGAPLAAALL